jgi:hypothetical protein
VPSQKIVRCEIRRKDDGTGSTVRYVPLEIYGLWRYLMEEKHRFEVVRDETSLWIDVDESPEIAYDEPRYEPVTEVSLFLYSDPAGMYSRVSRYFPSADYEKLKSIFLSHYLPGKRAGDPELPMRERPGVWIRKAAPAA